MIVSNNKVLDTDTIYPYARVFGNVIMHDHLFLSMIFPILFISIMKFYWIQAIRHQYLIE